MEIVDEDPARRWIQLGGIVVLSGDVMQLNPLEFVLKLAHLLAVCRHEGAFAGELLHDLVNDQLRVTIDIDSCSAELDGDAQPVDEGLIFRDIV